jgi:hypothetical protein
MSAEWIEMVDPARTAEICERLNHHFGRDAFSFVSAQVEQARQASDEARLELWNEVARRLVHTGLRDEAAEDREWPASLWGFMQWIEYCRHRALEAERKSATAPNIWRADIVELARQWRDLALHADLLRQALDTASARKRSAAARRTGAAPS